MRKAIRVLALALVLAAPVCAGEMQCPPPSTPPQSAQEATTQGDMNCPLVEIVLNLLTLF